MGNHKTLNSIKSFDIFNDFEIIQNQNGTVFINGEKGCDEVSYYYYDGSYLYFHLDAKKIQRYNLKTGILDEIENKHPLSEPKGGIYLRSGETVRDKELNRFLRTIEIYSAATGEKIYSTKAKYSSFAQFWLDENLFFTSHGEDSVITNLHLPTETTLWQYDTSVLGVERVEKIFGVFGKVLVVLGQKASESAGSGVPNLPIIFGISTESGELLWKQDEAFLHGYDAPYSVYTPLLETQTGRVVIFSNGLYTEIDATSGEIILWKNLHENPLSASGHAMDRFCFDPSQVDETYIYFRTGIGPSSKRTGLGVFNRKLQQLESLEILKDENGKPVSMGPQRIQATKDKIYALDLQNTLHIFERE